MYLKRVKKRKEKKRKRTIFDYQVLPTTPNFKQVDGASTITQFSNSPTANVMNGMFSGEDYFRRIGNKIEMYSLHITGYIDPTQASPGLPSLMRMIVVYDKQANGAAPLISDVIKTVNTNGVEETTACSQLNYTARDRYIILYDKYMYGVGYLGTAGQPPTFMEGANLLSFSLLCISINTSQYFNLSPSTQGGADGRI